MRFSPGCNKNRTSRECSKKEMTGQNNVKDDVTLSTERIYFMPFHVVCLFHCLFNDDYSIDEDFREE